MITATAWGQLRGSLQNAGNFCLASAFNRKHCQAPCSDKLLQIRKGIKKVKNERVKHINL